MGEMTLIPAYSAVYIAEKFVNFSRLLMWYRMYCICRYGKTKKDYVVGFEQVKDSFNYLEEFVKIPNYLRDPIDILFSKIEVLLNKRSMSEEHYAKIANLIFDFQKTETDIMNSIFEFLIRMESDLFYGKELNSLVSDLLEKENYEEAVITAFKYLDKRLQQKIGLSSYEYYGEDLINAAFAPGYGKLQLNTHPNEQKGMRNFFSGAYALFNPSCYLAVAE